MPGDYSQYVNLKPYDVSVVDVYLGAQELARVTLPEFNLRQGTVEDAMFQAFSYIQMLGVSAINRLPSRLMEGLARMLGVSRNEGSRAVVDTILTFNDDVSIKLERGVGATYKITIADSVVEYPFATTIDVSVVTTTARVASTGNVAIATDLQNSDTIDGVTLVTGDKVLLKDQTAGEENGCYTVVSSGVASRSPGADIVNYISNYQFPQFISVTEGTANAGTGWYVSNRYGTITLGTTEITYAASLLPIVHLRLTSLAVGAHPPPSAGDPMVLTSVIPELEAAVVGNPTNFAAGSNPESDREYLDRCTTHLESLSSASVTENQLKRKVLTDNSHISRANVYDLTTSADRILNQLPLASPAGPTLYPGYSLIVAYGIGRNLTPTEKSTLALVVSNLTIAGLTLAVVDPILIDLTVTADVTVAKNRTSTEMALMIKNRLKGILHVNEWTGVSESIMASDVSQAIRNIGGVDFVQNLVIAPSGAASIAATDWYGSGTTQGNILDAAGDPNIYYLSKGSYPHLSATTQITLNITVNT